MEVHRLCLGHIFEDGLRCKLVVEDIVHQDFTYDKYGDDHGDVFFSEFYLSIQKFLITTQVRHFMWQFKFAIEANDMAKLGFLEVNQEIWWNPKFSQRDHAQETVHLVWHSFGFFCKGEQKQLEPDRKTLPPVLRDRFVKFFVDCAWN